MPRHIPGIRQRALLLLLLSLPLRSFAQVRVLDDFETLSGWSPVTSHGDASKLTLTAGPGKTGKGMVMEFSFLGHMGSAAAEKKLALQLPSNYQISFDLRADAPVNNFIIRLMDTLDNVWIVMRSNYEFPRAWTKFTIRKDQITYGWGPAGSGELRMLDRMMLMVDVVEGGKGTIWIDNLTVEPLDESSGSIPTLRASSSGGRKPVFSPDGRIMTGWRSSGKKQKESLTFDFGHKTFLGGLAIDWDRADFARAFDVQMSENGMDWLTEYSVSDATGKKSYVLLAPGTGRYLRLVLKASPTGRYGIHRLEFKGTGFSFSVNDFFTAIAAESPVGYYPRYLLQKQSYWTVIGAAGDTREALMNEQGMIETDKLNFSLEPFLSLDGGMTTWADATITPALEKDYLPIPSVRWETNNGVSLTVTACAAGSEGESVLYVRYTVQNVRSSSATGKLFVALRPFQVNPPWQTFTIVGGAARVDSVRCGEVLQINKKEVYPVTRPDGIGAATFDQGDITEYLKEGIVPPSQVVHDHLGYASAALAYDFSLKPGGKRNVVVAVPFHQKHALLPMGQDDLTAASLFERECSATARFWESKLNAVHISLPPSAPPIERTIKSNLAFTIINADGPALQPGSRSYERSWLRDGALTSVALLQMGVSDEVRRYLDWYAGYQYPDGSIPCIVEPRGPEPTPEHDSHGEFIYAILEYYHFTHDTTWLQGKWEHVSKTVRFIQSLRGRRKTEVYRTGTPDQRAVFGLVPESISHEGYCPKPMHSYWDDFFILRGLKDATTIAEILGKKEEAKAFAVERDDFRHDLFASMRMVIQNKHIGYIPGCAELGDLDPTGTTIGVMPCGELGNIPEPELHNTFDIYYQAFRGKRTDGRNDAYLPYEARAIGTFMMLGEKDRAEDMLDFFMACRRPAAWNGWGEVIHEDRDAPKGIGDMPHSWGASDVIRSIRSLLVYERESDTALVVGQGIPESWVRDPAGVRVEGLPTYFGPLSFAMNTMGDSLVVTLSGSLQMPPGKIMVMSPLMREITQVHGDCRPGARAGEVIVDRVPARVVMVY